MKKIKLNYYQWYAIKLFYHSCLYKHLLASIVSSVL